MREREHPMERAVVTGIQGYSIHDGPGIRTVVFLKGCPLRCVWCANPETFEAFSQTGFIESLCQDCGKCADVCPHGAIIPGSVAYRIDRGKCVGCQLCTDTCPCGALVSYGREMTSAEVYENVRRDKIFYDSSGGGVTVSGGEPLLSPSFVRELFESLRTDGINTYIETCGYVQQSALKEVLAVTDGFLFDLKLADSKKHMAYTGGLNDLIIENARFLVSQGVDVLFRHPLIPGVNDSEEDIRALSELIFSVGGNDACLQLMPYHKLGQPKYKALALEYIAQDIRIMTAGEITAVKKLYKTHGINCTISK